MTDKKELKIEFAPGCFDSFEGSQEELDELVAQIHEMFESGELEENATLVDIDELIEEDPELAEKILGTVYEPEVKRTLQ